MDSQKSFDDLLSKYKMPLAVGFVGLVLLIAGVVSSGIIPRTFVKSTKSPVSATQPQQTSPFEAKVDVSGEVRSPGVYALSGSARVEDALKAAGGVTESADPAYLSKTVNLAQRVSDGMKIYVPRISEAGPSAVVAQSGGDVAGVQTSMVNINAASLSELEKLPGVGEVTAQKIIDGRPYGGIEELFTKKAVNRSVYEKIKDKVATY